MKHIISFSGGIGSFMAAKRIVDQYGKENILCVFTDTKIEDADLYRFVDEAIKYLDCEFLRIEEGRTPWEVFFDEKYMGNSRFGNCTKRLKQIPFRKWLEDNYKPDECVVYLGIDWSESHRYERAIPHWEPYTVKAPMCNEPFVDKSEMLDFLNSINIEVPRLYKLGMSHNNCGGFCVKAGHGHFKNLLQKLPEVYAYHEAQEQLFRKTFDKDVSILKREITIGYKTDENGKKKAIRKSAPVTMKELREVVEQEQKLLECGLKADKKNQLGFDFDDFGGCGCMIDFE